MSEIVIATNSQAKVAEKVRWTEAQVTVLEQEVAKAAKKKDAFEVVSKLINKSTSTIAAKWYDLRKGPKTRKTPLYHPAVSNLPTPNLSPGQVLMNEILSKADFRCSEVTINKEGMYIKF